MMTSSVGDVAVHSSMPSDVEALVQAAVSVLANDMQANLHDQNQVQVVLDSDGQMQVESNQVQVMVDAAAGLQERLYMCTDCNIAFYGETGEQEWQWHLKQHRPFKCELCTEAFELKDTLQQHMRSHSVQMPYICEQCGSAYSLKNNLVQHMKTHENSEIYKCNQCECVFKFQQHLDRHIKFHTGESIKVYQCEQCSKTFSQQKNLVQHMKIHQGVEKPFKCTECPAAYSYKCHLQRHLIIHTGEKPYRCKFCAKSFNRNAHLIRHRKIHSNEEKQWKCDQCNFSFWEKSDLYRHVKSHEGNRPLACQFCPQTFVWKRYLLKHLNNHHKTDDRFFCIFCCACSSSPEGLEDHEKARHANKKQLTHTCNICNEEFHFKFKLDEHMFVHTGQKAHKCEKCEAAFVSRKELERHIEAHSQEVSFHCNTCDKTFASIDDLQRHLKVHTGRGRFMCSECDATFKWKSQLTTHMVSHTDTHAFQCGHCDKEFKRSKDLKRHERIYHETKPPYTCTDCGEDFHTPWNLHQHDRKGHPGKHAFEYECPYCTGAFKKESDLTRHTTKVHPPRPFQCNTCFKRFTQLKFLQKHLELKHEITELIDGETYNVVPGQKKKFLPTGNDSEEEKAEKIIVQDGHDLDDGMAEIEKYEKTVYTTDMTSVNSSSDDTHIASAEGLSNIKISSVKSVPSLLSTAEEVRRSLAPKGIQIPRVVTMTPKDAQPQPKIRIVKQTIAGAKPVQVLNRNFKIETSQQQTSKGTVTTIPHTRHQVAVTPAQLQRALGLSQGQTVFTHTQDFQHQPISEAITLANIHRGRVNLTETEQTPIQQQQQVHKSFSQLQNVPNIVQIPNISAATSTVLHFPDSETSKSNLMNAMIYNLAASATGNEPMQILQNVTSDTGSVIPQQGQRSLQIGSQQQEIHVPEQDTSSLLPQMVEIQNFSDGTQQLVIEAMPAGNQ